MNANKIRELLAEINSELGGMDLRRQRLMAAKVSLSSLLDDAAAIVAVSPSAFSIEAEKASYIDDSEELIREAGHPLHAKLLAEKISVKRGVPVARNSVESSLIRHIRKAKNPKLAKMGRSTFGLSEWKRSALAQTA